MAATPSHPRALTPEDLAQPHPVFVVWEITLACDQACRHCGSRAGLARASELDTSEALDLVRQLAWLEQNRRRVQELSDGRLAYVYLPNTADAGYDAFTRDFYAQLDKQGVVVDERFNGGGYVADYIVDMLAREPLNWLVTREGRPYSSPTAVIPGPRVMIINQHAGSGGDCLPSYFRQLGLGPLVGTRTWGGLIGIYDYPPLMDGGVVTAPRIAFYGPESSWTAENVGVAPDVEVEITPADFQAGRDPQLERAVEIALEALEAAPPVRAEQPAFPDYSGG